MGYFDDQENVEYYIRLAEGFDGRELIDVLKRHLPKGATVLELGMGPGKDLDMLTEFYQVTGSDSSRVFVERYRKSHPDQDLLLLDAVTMDTDRKFDAIYSNKVLHHLTQEELKASLRRQFHVLNARGILLHSMSYGDGEEDQHGLRFVYYTEESFAALLGPEYDVVESKRYTEMEEDDSFYVVLRKSRPAP